MTWHYRYKCQQLTTTFGNLEKVCVTLEPDFGLDWLKADNLLAEEMSSSMRITTPQSGIQHHCLDSFADSVRRARIEYARLLSLFLFVHEKRV